MSAERREAARQMLMCALAVVLLPLLLPLLAVISAAAWLFEILGCGEIRDFLQPANGRAKRRCARASPPPTPPPAACRSSSPRHRTRRLPAARLLVALPFLASPMASPLFVLPLVRFGWAEGTSTGRTARWATCARWHSGCASRPSTSLSRKAPRGSCCSVRSSSTMHRSSAAAAPAARDLRRRPRDAAAAAAAALPAARVPAAHRCPASTASGPPPPRHRRRPLRPHADALAPSAAGGRARALSVRLIWELACCSSSPRAPSCSSRITSSRCSSSSPPRRQLAYRASAVTQLQMGLLPRSHRAARAPFVAPGHAHRKTLHNALVAAAAPPIALSAL